MREYSTEPETSSRAIIGLRDTSFVANRLWNCTLRPKYGVIGDEPILEYSIRRCVLHASLKTRLSRVAIIAGDAIKSWAFTLAYSQPDPRSLNAILRNKCVSRSEEPKRPAALNRCLVTLEWHSKAPNAATSDGADFNRDFSTECSFTRYSISSLSFKDHRNRSREQPGAGGQGGEFFRTILFITVFSSLTSLAIRSALITVHHDRAHA